MYVINNEMIVKKFQRNRVSLESKTIANLIQTVLLKTYYKEVGTSLKT